MTHQFDPAALLPRLSGDRGDLLARLLDLLERIEWNAAQETLTIRNGASSIRLEANGTIHIEGERIVQSAAQDINLAAGWIDLN